MVMDVYQDYILVSYLPFIIHVYHVKLYGELTPSSKAYLEVSLFLPHLFDALVTVDMHNVDF